MIGTPQTPPATARALLAEELLAAIKNSSYDSQTLQEIVLVIDHECLCRESQDRFPNLRRPDDISNRAIATSVIGDFAEQLSSCLVHHINASSRLIRELQFRALLSVLALLQLDGVHAVHADVHRKWQTKINNRFRELIWLPGQSPRLSTETFPRVQCAHLISLGAAYYSQQFVPAEPVAARILAIGSNVMQLVVMVANIALV